jgi:agmatinase
MKKATQDQFSGWLHSGSGGSFMRAQRVEAEIDALRAAGVSAAVLGFPWDAMCISRTGTNHGPYAIREASDQFSFFNANTGVDLQSHYTFADCGDVPVVPGSAVTTMDRAQALLSNILSADAMPITVGGDHSVTIACVRSFAKKYSTPGLILVDSHFDTALDVGGEELSHCCPITRAVDAGFDPKRIVIVGTNGWMNPRSELDYILDNGIKLIPIEEIIEKGATRVGIEAREIASDGADSVYLTFDIDSIDAAYAPGTGVSAPGGMTSREALALVAELGRGGLGGFDLVEVSPPYDHDGVTSRLAVRLILDIIAATVKKV